MCLGREQSRRDDLESLGYVMVYFLKGSLPWQGLRATTKKQKYEKIKENKVMQPIETLCRGCPSEFVMFFRYVRSLHYHDKPDYGGLRKRFRELFTRTGFTWDYIFDWCVVPTQVEVQPRPHDLSSRAILGSARFGVGAFGAETSKTPGKSENQGAELPPKAPRSKKSIIPPCFHRCEWKFRN